MLVMLRAKNPIFLERGQNSKFHQFACLSLKRVQGGKKRENLVFLSFPHRFKTIWLLLQQKFLKMVPNWYRTNLERGVLFFTGLLERSIIFAMWLLTSFLYYIREYEQNPTLVPKWYAYQFGTNFIPLLKPPYHPDAVVEVSPTGLKFLRKDQRLTSASKSAI